MGNDYAPTGVPYRYAREFRVIRVAPLHSTEPFHWQCRRCGQIIRPNTAGAQSHVAKHLRRKESRDDDVLGHP